MADNELKVEEFAKIMGEATKAAVAPMAAEIKELREKSIGEARIVELEGRIKAAEELADKKVSAASAQWAAVMDANKTAGDHFEFTPESAAKMVGKIAAAGALALKETNTMHLTDKQVALDFAKKMFPNDKSMHEIMQKDMVANIPSAGGYGIPQSLLPDYVNYLYAKTLLDKIGATRYPMPAGNLKLARVDATSSFTWGGETPTGNATQPTLGDIVLNAKKGTAIVPISNTLLRYNAIGLDTLISKDLQTITKIALDNALLYGAGNSYQPLGLELTTGVQPYGTSGSPTALTVQAPIDIVALLEQSSVPMENVAWLLNPLAKSWLMGKAFSSGPFAWAQEMASGSKTLNGFPYYSSATVAHSSTTWANIWLADWSELVWGVSYDIALDVSREGTYVNSGGTTVSAFQRDETLIRLITEQDFQVKHGASFVECFVSKGS
jgi:HK97 family phage major capsid protein